VPCLAARRALETQLLCMFRFMEYSGFTSFQTGNVMTTQRIIRSKDAE